MRLIDKDAMIADLVTVDSQFKTMIDWCIRVTEAQPTVDAVPVIRCKDCKYYRGYAGVVDGYCYMAEWYKRYQYPDDYCSRAERRRDHE